MVRPDRIGDVVLSTPLLASLHKVFPDRRLTLLVQKPVVPLVSGLPAVSDILVYDPDHRHRGWSGWRALIRELSERKFDAALVLQAPTRVAMAVRLAGIPLRVGPLSKPMTHLAYNRGVRQRRSRADRHETEYGRELTERMVEALAPGTKMDGALGPTQISLQVAVREEARTWLDSHGLGARRVAVVHAGMGGSALNWPQQSYVELAWKLRESGVAVLVTAGPSEQLILDYFRGHFRKQESEASASDLAPVAYYGGSEARAVDFLAALFSHASVVVAPSTGPLHLAAALGVAVVTLYPPIRVQTPTRWGPWQKPEGSEVLVPPVECPAVFRCRGPSCPHYFCMEKITVEAVFEKVLWSMRVNP